PYGGEEFEYQIKWMASTAKYLMGKQKASLYMSHWHIIDLLQHLVPGRVDPVGGKYDPDKADKAWKILRMGYTLADRVVREFLNFMDDDDYLVIVSDHGNVPNGKKYSVTKALADRGLVSVEESEG
ncbi:unnamed protein product, partial [marine sediment metagenome]